MQRMYKIPTRSQSEPLIGVGGKRPLTSPGRGEFISMRHPTKYSGRWQGSAHHQQADTGLGFTVDEQLVKFVSPLREKGFLTTGGWCQNTSESVGYEQWVIPRRRIGYLHNNPNILLELCLHVKRELLRKTGWNQTIEIDGYSTETRPFAVLTFARNLDSSVLKAIETFSV